MKTKPICCELEINAVPFEKLEYNHTSKIILYVDDITEQRWRIMFTNIQAFKILSNELGYNYNIEDFEKYYYEDSSGRHFKNYILEVEDSVWLQNLKKKVDYNLEVFESLSNAKHYLIAFYDYQLEVIACGVKLEKL